MPIEAKMVFMFKMWEIGMVLGEGFIYKLHGNMEVKTYSFITKKIASKQ